MKTTEKTSNEKVELKAALQTKELIDDFANELEALICKDEYLNLAENFYINLEGYENPISLYCAVLGNVHFRRLLYQAAYPGIYAKVSKEPKKRINTKMPKYNSEGK